MIKKLWTPLGFFLMLCLNGAAQNIGIGNTNPSFLLDVSSQIRIRSKDALSTAGIYFNKIDNSGVQAYVGMHSDNYVGLYGVPLGAWGVMMNTTNGNLGIGNVNPAFLLDVSGRIRIRSKDAINTAGIYFNKIDNSNMQAFVGMHSDNYLGLFGVPLNNWGLLMNTTNGNIGIGNIVAPQAVLHVVKGQRTNGPLLSTSAVIIDGDQGGWLQLSNNNNIEAGILSGNQQTTIRSGIVFGADSSIHLRTGGNSTNLLLTKAGDIALSGNANLSGELRRPSTGSANLVPICLGSMSGSSGTITGGSGNFSVEHYSTGNFHITIAGESYNNADYITSVTLVEAEPGATVKTGALDGKLTINMYRADGGQLNFRFHFIVYKP